MRPKTISLSALAERDHPVTVDNVECVDDDMDYAEQNGCWPDDVHDAPRWLWMTERRDRRLSHRIGIQSPLKLSTYACALVTRDVWLTEQRHEKLVRLLRGQQ